jgi:alanyl-tRNA synthetase
LEDKVKETQSEQINVAMRVIADHVRTIAFSIADGQLPSNAKAGYVIRRILRRAVRYGYTFLNQREAFIYRLIPTLVESMGDAYPELRAQQTLIEKVMKEEEESFLRTLETGIKLLDREIQTLPEGGVLKGEVVFTLYDTYGFPLDLTELILREHNMTVDIAGFNVEMAKQKERARNAAAVETADWVVLREGETEFVGYDSYEVKTNILRYRKVKQKNREFYQIVLEKTPFYAEMGGQVGDSGQLDNGQLTIIFDTKRENNLMVHLAEKLPENVNDTFLAKIDVKKRRATQANHSATHIVHEALREVLGKHVEQKGSYVSPDVLRFDFSHFQKMTKDEIHRVEHLANERIRNDFHLQEMRNVPIAEAKKMGAMALFGEKYGETVRVVQFGSSVELCGGTHVRSTGEIGMVRIISESSIAAGIRRIEAITGESVENVIDIQQDIISDLREFFNNSPNLVAAVQKSIEENAELKKQVETFVQEKISEMCDRLIGTQQVQEIHGISGVTVVKRTLTLSPEQIKTLAFMLRNKMPEKLFVAIGSVFDGKPSLTVLLSEDLVTSGLNAANIIRTAAKEIQGGGGGQPFFAQAGGKNAEGIERALEIAVNI